ncbi:unnamed protein product, partial [Mesorhabditis belari]|uniref:C-type lectin domain-containing protein n=1 Tax=Mesorhabditis belari TaxID=2138241 RepID=A0AAF3JAY0_9BILA
MFRLLLVSQLVAISVTKCPPRPLCPSGWSYSAEVNSCFKIVSKDGGIDSDSATALCKEAGGQLASIHSAEENNVIIDLANTGRNVTTGYHTLVGGVRKAGASLKEFTWTDGSPYDFQFWHSPQQPDNRAGIQNCLQIYTSNQAAYPSAFTRWDDAECNAKFINAVCKISLGQAPCPVGWTYQQAFKSCYKSIDSVTFVEANAQCKGMGSQLASVHSNEENAFIIEFTKLGRNISDYEAQPLLGGMRTGTGAKDWTWTDGTPFDYLNWVDGEPNNAGGKESCLQVYTDRWGLGPFRAAPPGALNYLNRWNDYPCDVKYRIALCKQPAK